jgi:hypothetical protein
LCGGSDSGDGGGGDGDGLCGGSGLCSGGLGDGLHRCKATQIDVGCCNIIIYTSNNYLKISIFHNKTYVQKLTLLIKKVSYSICYQK